LCRRTRGCSQNRIENDREQRKGGEGWGTRTRSRWPEEDSRGGKMREKGAPRQVNGGRGGLSAECARGRALGPSASEKYFPFREQGSAVQGPSG